MLCRVATCRTVWVCASLKRSQRTTRAADKVSSLIDDLRALPTHPHASPSHTHTHLSTRLYVHATVRMHCSWTETRRDAFACASCACRDVWCMLHVACCMLRVAVCCRLHVACCTLCVACPNRARHAARARRRCLSDRDRR